MWRFNLYMLVVPKKQIRLLYEREYMSRRLKKDISKCGKYDDPRMLEDHLRDVLLKIGRQLRYLNYGCYDLIGYNFISGAAEGSDKDKLIALAEAFSETFEKAFTEM